MRSDRRKIALFLGLWALFFPKGAFGGEISVLHFIVDLDNTLIFRDVQKDEQLRNQAPASHIVQADGQIYRIAWGAPEFIAFLLNIPKAIPGVKTVQLTFNSAYSGPDPLGRMKTILGHMRLPSGGSALDFASRLNVFGDLWTPDYDVAAAWAGLPFSLGEDFQRLFTQERFKKRVRVPGPDPEHFFIYDDNPGWILPDEFKHWIYLRNSSRNGEMARIAALTSAALTLHLDGVRSLPEAIHALQWSTRHGYLEFLKGAEAIRWQKLGEALLQTVAPKFEIRSSPFSEIKCKDKLGGEA